MAVVDPFTIYAVTAGLLLLIICIVTLISKFTASSAKTAPQRGQGVVVPQPVNDRQGPVRVRRRLQRHRRPADDDDDEDSIEDDDEDLPEIVQPEGKVGAKKLKKLQEKAERKAMREQEERDREDKKKREKELEAQRKKQEELDKQEAAIREEEEKKRKAEQEAREHEEYLKMKEMFSVEEEGEADLQADLNSESLLSQFINYIKESKVVMLEDLAGYFKLNVQDVIQRVQDLQVEGRLTGVIDDRGKFIYITMEELEAVARYIRQNGRVSITDLAASSNRLINLDPDTSSLALKLVAEVDQMVSMEEVSVH